MIAGPYPDDLRIVRTWPAGGTGESYYQTEDGRVWKTSFYQETITGVSYGSIEGDRMISPPRSRGYWPSSNRRPPPSRPHFQPPPKPRRLFFYPRKPPPPPVLRRRRHRRRT